jgi:hypothetical protein
MRKLDGSIGTVGGKGTVDVRKETTTEKRKRLINKASELEMELSHIESQLWDTVIQIQDLKPTKKELEDGVQDLIDCYGR